MKILFLLSSLEPAGSETYCLALAKAWKNRHEVFWISDALHFGQPYRSLPISRKAVPWGIFNTLRVARFIRHHRIDIIHSHSRRAHWVAAQAAKLTGIAHVTTLHQQLPVHFFSKTFPCLGDAVIAIDEAVAEHTQAHFSIPASRVHVIRNGILLPALSPAPPAISGQKTILLIGRLSGGRWNAFQFFLKTLEHARLPPALYKIAGHVPEERRAGLLPQLSALNARLAPARIELSGFVNDLAAAIRDADAVIAAGRSALEALANGRPVVILGEGGTLGLCQNSAWPAALRTNFADHLTPPRFDAATLESGLKEVLLPRESWTELIRWGRAQVEIYYDLAKIAPEIETLYERVKK